MDRSFFILTNILLSGILEFLLGVLLLWGVLKVFKIRNPRIQFVLCLMPFVKLLSLLLFGLPASSILYSQLSPLLLPRGHQMLTLSFGASSTGLGLNLIFDTHDFPTAGSRYTIGAVDYLSYWFVQRGWGGWLAAAIVGFLCFSLVRVVTRAIAFFRFETSRRRTRDLGRSIRVFKLGWRMVDAYISFAHEGSPFTGGIFRPYICFPHQMYSKFSSQERRAILAHELGHVAHYDAVVQMAINFLRDVFWFVPFYRRLSLRVAQLHEILADARAIRFGSTAHTLINALMKASQCIRNETTPAHCFVRPQALRERVETIILVQQRRRKWYEAARTVLVTMVLASLVLGSHVGTNAERVPELKVPTWLARVLKISGQSK